MLNAVVLPMIIPKVAIVDMALLVLAVVVGRARGVRAMVRLGGMAMAIVDAGNGQRTQVETRTGTGEEKIGKVTLRDPGPSSSTGSAGRLGGSRESGTMGRTALTEDEACADSATAADGKGGETLSNIVSMARRAGSNESTTFPNSIYMSKAQQRATAPSARGPRGVAAAVTRSAARTPAGVTS